MKKIVPIITLTADFAGVMRVLKYRAGHRENDAEHSYQLAVVSWSANHQYKLGLHDEKILKYALVHDLVELYAGDTDAFGDEEKIAAKEENEEKAFKILKQKYAEFPEILEVIENYKKREDLESQLVYVLDKLISHVNVYNSRDDYYHRRKVDIAVWRKRLFKKIDYQSVHPKLKPIVDESIQEIETTYKDTFYKK